MTNIPFFQVDAFVTHRPLTGNPAAVMPLERWLDDTVLQAIAAENNLSETAFTVPSEDAGVDYDLRWFTPTVEVDLCGHASLASGHVLLKGDRVRFATKSGVLTVSRNGDLLELDLPAHAVERQDLPGLADALGVSGETFLGRSGNGAAIMLLENEEAVRAVSPDFAALCAFDRLVIVTAHGDEQDVASRVFAAYHGIDEDPVTGSAHAALTPFWAERLGRSRFTALQASKRGGILDCRLEEDRVILGGRCATTIVGTFQL
ncbi:PhzF family phenazine biosynthesis protein [Sphingomonas piscis]|uniref:PhzF family phenazine biosynthesis protein n=1 Tax=Sphingomonas piscis TaxID=2714943 RepID=A0A6G7YNZ9_9SPHN|nr:PhzF family phenazine biosynthesis protein [Sphingomonas piscis]QIK78470.1 PhzF family phenazine biosynthesis protein [Sphingomonas piscis]